MKRTICKRPSLQSLQASMLKPQMGQTIKKKKMIYFPLKWGEVKMPKDWSRHPTDGQEPEEVGHLSFGTVLDCPSPPKDGRLYV